MSNTIEEVKNTLAIEEIKSFLNIVLAIEILEYEDSNFLAYDAQRRTEDKMKLLKKAIFLIENSLVS